MLFPSRYVELRETRERAPIAGGRRINRQTEANETKVFGIRVGPRVFQTIFVCFVIFC
jgi:hypothetical protein